MEKDKNWRERWMEGNLLVETLVDGSEYIKGSAGDARALMMLVFNGGSNGVAPNHWNPSFHLLISSSLLPHSWFLALQCTIYLYNKTSGSVKCKCCRRNIKKMVSCLESNNGRKRQVGWSRFVIWKRGDFSFTTTKEKRLFFPQKEKERDEKWIGIGKGKARGLGLGKIIKFGQRRK